MLGERVVHGDDGIFEGAVLGHSTQADDPRGGLLGAADYAGHEVEALGDQQGHQIGAVVHGDLRLVLQSSGEMRIVRLVVLALNGKRRDAVVLHQAGSDLVLRR